MWHKAMGPATALRVQAGDKVELDAWVRYKTKPTYHRHMTPLLMGQLLSGTYAGLGVFEGYTATQAAPLFESLAAAMQGTGEEDDRPFAYLNFALFAHDMSLLDAGWERIPEEAGFGTGEESLPNRHKRVAFAVPVVVPEDGFIYIWLSNESEGTEVWFDDLSIRHTQTLVAQATDYGVWGEVLREQRADARKYRFGYQGQYAEKDEETGWNHFELRQYDAVIGRWLSVDPYRQYHSPYVGMGNNPVNGVDPDGGKDIIHLLNGKEVGRISTEDPFDIVIFENEYPAFDYTSITVGVFDKIFYSRHQLSPSEYQAQYELYFPKATGATYPDYTIEALLIPGPKGMGNSVASKSLYSTAKGFEKTFLTSKMAFRFAKSINRIPGNLNGYKSETYDRITGKRLDTWTFQVGKDRYVIRQDIAREYWKGDPQSQLQHFNVSKNGMDLGQHFTFMR
jgi:RHS repeat-associated protein